MYTREVSFEKEDCHVRIGIATHESFNFNSGMEACMNAIAYVTVNGIAIDRAGVFEFLTIGELAKLVEDV
jgi:hypothetical protein